MHWQKCSNSFLVRELVLAFVILNSLYILYIVHLNQEYYSQQSIYNK